MPDYGKNEAGVYSDAFSTYTYTPETKPVEDFATFQVVDAPVVNEDNPGGPAGGGASGDDPPSEHPGI